MSQTIIDYIDFHPDFHPQLKKGPSSILEPTTPEKPDRCIRCHQPIPHDPIEDIDANYVNSLKIMPGGVQEHIRWLVANAPRRTESDDRVLKRFEPFIEKIGSFWETNRAAGEVANVIRCFYLNSEREFDAYCPYDAVKEVMYLKRMMRVDSSSPRLEDEYY